MSLPFGYTELEGSPSHEGGGGKLTTKRTFRGPWDKYEDFLLEIFGFYDAGLPVIVVPPVTLQEFGGFSTLYPKTFTVKNIPNQPQAKVADLSSIYSGPGTTPTGESEATEENTDWGCAEIEVTWETYKGEGTQHQGGQDNEQDPPGGVVITTEFDYSTEHLEIPNRTLSWDSTGEPLPADHKETIPITNTFLTLNVTNIARPNFVALLTYGDSLNETVFEGYPVASLIFLGAKISGRHEPMSGLVYDLSLKFWNRRAGGYASIFNMGWNPEIEDFDFIETSTGDNPIKEVNEFSDLYQYG